MTRGQNEQRLTSKALPASRPKRRHAHGNGKLKVVTRGSEALRAAETVSDAAGAAQRDGAGEDEGKVDDQRCGDAQHRRDLVRDVGALRGEEHDDGVEEADEGEGRDGSEEVGLVARGAEEAAEEEAGEDGGAEGDAYCKGGG